MRFSKPWLGRSAEPAKAGAAKTSKATNNRGTLKLMRLSTPFLLLHANALALRVLLLHANGLALRTGNSVQSTEFPAAFYHTDSFLSTAWTAISKGSQRLPNGGE
jgi:hypothetical protein